MRKKCWLVALAVTMSCLVFCLAYTQTVTVAPAPVSGPKIIDINKDGKPDVTYSRVDERITKMEADTNFDGKPDVTVYAEDGKFKSAEADTDYDGKPEKKFSTNKEFNVWVNKEKPQFKDPLTEPDWTYYEFKF